MRTEGGFRNEGCVTYEVIDTVRDFSDTFRHRSESIYFDLSKDPFTSASRPYMAEVTVNITVDDELDVEDDDEYFLLLTTESLFDGWNYKPSNLRFISKYVYLKPGTESYTFDKVHPGTY